MPLAPVPLTLRVATLRRLEDVERGATLALRQAYAQSRGSVPSDREYPCIVPLDLYVALEVVRRDDESDDAVANRALDYMGIPKGWG